MLSIAGRAATRVGVIGEIESALIAHFNLVGPVVAFELRIDTLDTVEDTDRAVVRPSDFPPVERDLNLIVDEDVSWSSLASAIDEACGGLLDRLSLTQVWRDDGRIGPGRKSVVVSLSLRSQDATLSGDEVKEVINTIIETCTRRCGAALRA